MTISPAPNAPMDAPDHVTIRFATSKDLNAIGDLWEELLAFHIERDRRFQTARKAREAFLRYVSSSVLRNRDHALYVAEADGSVAGFMIGRLEHGGPIFADPDFGYITDACVGSAFRRYGLGKLLFANMRDWFRSRGIHNIRVSVAAENPVSQAFWKDLGFQPFMERWWYDLD